MSLLDGGTSNPATGETATALTLAQAAQRIAAKPATTPEPRERPTAPVAEDDEQAEQDQTDGGEPDEGEAPADGEQTDDGEQPETGAEERRAAEEAKREATESAAAVQA